MTDLIQTLVARTLGLEPVVQPSVGSLYEPADGAAWERSPLQEVVEEVIVRPPMTAAAGFPGSRPSSADPASTARINVGSLPAAPISASSTVRSQDPPAATLPTPFVKPVAPTSVTTTSLLGPPPRAPVPSASVPTTTLSRKHERENVGGGIDRIAAVFRDRVATSPLQPSTASIRPTSEEGVPPNPAAPSVTAAPGTTAAPTPGGRLEEAVSTTMVPPQPAQPGQPVPAARPVPVAPDAEPEPPVIQVTIGRVEVRAITPPQAAAPPAHRRPFPSLEEYLERTSEART